MLDKCWLLSLESKCISTRQYDLLHLIHQKSCWINHVINVVFKKLIGMRYKVLGSTLANLIRDSKDFLNQLLDLSSPMCLSKRQIVSRQLCIISFLCKNCLSWFFWSLVYHWSTQPVIGRSVVKLLGLLAFSYCSVVTVGESFQSSSHSPYMNFTLVKIRFIEVI